MSSLNQGVIVSQGGQGTELGKLGDICFGEIGLESLLRS